MVPAALRASLHHIDTAQVYRNEDAVGDLVAASKISRSGLFLTTKVWVANYPARSFAVSVNESLKRLRTDYVNLLLLHWPSNAVPLDEQIAGLETAVKAGKARNVGVNNFNGAMVAEATRLSSVPLATNQFEYHPYLNQKIAIEATQRAGLSA
jgi:diketogulonate reductase-like aldo/keto reductase